MIIGGQIAGCHLRANPLAFDLLRHFGAITPGGNFGLKRCLKDSDNLDLEITDWVIENLVNSPIRIHGHCLLQGNFDIPRWRELAKHEFEFKLKSALQQVCDRYQGVISEWEFLGEVVSPRGGLSNSVLRDRLGVNFPLNIYQWIREIDPVVPLYYSEYGLESLDKLDATLRFCENLLNSECNLTGVAIQFHHNTKGAITLSGIEKAIAKFKSLGLKTKLSEVTIWRDAVGLGALSALAQAEAYGRLFEIAIATNCESFTFWCPVDKYSWKLAERCPGLWDEDFKESLVFEKISKIAQKHSLSF